MLPKEGVKWRVGRPGIEYSEDADENPATLLYVEFTYKKLYIILLETKYINLEKKTNVRKKCPITRSCKKSLNRNYSNDYKISMYVNYINI